MLLSINHYYPPSELPFIAVHFWAVVIVVNCLAYGLVGRIRFNILPESKSKSRYIRIFWFVVLWMNVPWLLMGIGILFGGVGSIINFGVFWEPNTIVLAWWTAIAALATSGIIWLNAGGAEELAKYPLLPMVPVADPRKIKRYTVAAILLMPVGFTLWQNSKVLVVWLVEHKEWKMFGSIIAIGCIVGFAVFLMFIAYQCTEWTALTKYYRAKNPFTGKLISGRTSKLSAGLTGAIQFGFDSKALHLSFSSMNRIGRPPLLVPWADIKSQVVKTRSFKGFRLIFKKVPLAPLIIPIKWALKFREESNNPKLARVFPTKSFS